MGLFSKKDKNIYGEYAKELAEENYTLSDEGIIPIGQRQNLNHAPHALTADEVKGNEPIAPTEDIPMESAGESLYKRMMDARKTDDEADKKAKEVKLAQESLLSRCSPFVSDTGEKPILQSQPAYTLDSVESIIAEAERKAQERVKRIYGGEEEEDTAEAPKTESHTARPTNTEEIVMTRSEVSNYQYRYADEDRQSEFKKQEPLQEEPIEEVAEETPTAEEATISFTPINEEPATDSGSTMSFIPVGNGETQSFGDEIKQSLGMDIGELFPEEKENISEEISEQEMFGDYETAADAVPIHKDLCNALRKINLRLIFTLLITVALTVMAVFSAGNDAGLSSPKPSPAILIIETALLAVATLINLDVFRGFAALAGKSTGADLPAALCTTASLIYGIICIATGETDALQTGFIAAAGLLFSCFGKRNNAKRVLIGFEQIANDEEKYALTLIDEDHGSFAIAHDAVEGEALVAAGRKTINITRYLKNSLSLDRFGKKATVISVIGFIIAIALMCYGFVSETAVDAIYIFTAILSLSQPLSSALVGTLPLKMASRRLADYDAMVVSEDAAEVIEQANAAVFDICSIFPRGRVKMYDMKILSPNNLDSTIFNAAAVTTQINSPLGHVFRRIARTSEDYALPPADSVKYENRLGISGWVGDHSILIGNRTLMETHGVSVPSIEVDKKILRGGYFPVYVASDGRPCALLIVGYEADRDIETELKRLQNTGVVLLINNCDPNVTEEMLCDYFGLQGDYIKIMQSGSVKQYKDQTEFRESVSAAAAYSGNACSLAATITASNRIKKLTAAMAALHIILAVAGIAGAAVLICSGMGNLLTPINIALYLLASLNIVCLAPLFYKP